MNVLVLRPRRGKVDHPDSAGCESLLDELAPATVGARGGILADRGVANKPMRSGVCALALAAHIGHATGTAITENP